MSARLSKNPWVGVNFIHDNTRMEIPPAYFLQRIHDFDTELRIIPSRQTPFAYVVARKKRFSAGITFSDISWMRPDTQMCYHYNVVPVCLMYKTGPSWEPDQIIHKLKARDFWAHGGADAVCDQLEEQEAAEKEATRQKIRQELWDRSGDAWRTYQARTGQRVSLNPNVTRTGRRVPNSPSTSGSTAGSGATFSNRESRTENVA